MEKKKRLRQAIAQRREALTPEALALLDEKILSFVLGYKEYKTAAVLFCYVSMEKEPDTRHLLSKALTAGKRVAVPFCTGEGMMEAREIISMADLVPGKYGILEPVAGCSVIPPEMFDFAVIPCVSCGHQGARLGHGGGYYDRYMRSLRCVQICLCYEVLTCEDIPMEPHDLPISTLITDHGIFDFQNE